MKSWLIRLTIGLFLLGRACASVEGQTLGSGGENGPLEARETALESLDYEKISRQYWNAIREHAQRDFKGSTMMVDLMGGVESRENEIGANHGPYARLEMKVPLYSRDKKNKRNKEMESFLKEHLGTVQEFEANGLKLKILLKKSAVLKATMKDNGLEGIDAYYDNQALILETKTMIKEAMRRLDRFKRADR